VLTSIKKFLKIFFNIKEKKYILVLFFIYLSFTCGFVYLFFTSYKNDIKFGQNLIASYQLSLINTTSDYLSLVLKEYINLKENVKNVVYLDLRKKEILIDNKTVPFSLINEKELNNLLNIVSNYKNRKIFYEIVPYFNYGKPEKTIALFKKINDNVYKIYIFNPDKAFNLLKYIPANIKIKININNQTLFETSRGKGIKYKQYKYFIGNLPLDVHIGLVKSEEWKAFEKFKKESTIKSFYIFLTFIFILIILNTILLYNDNKFVENTIKRLEYKLNNISKILENHFEAPYLKSLLPKILKLIKDLFSAQRVYLKILPNTNIYIDENGEIKPLSPDDLKGIEFYMENQKGIIFERNKKYYFYFPIETKKKTLGFLLLELNKPLDEIDKKLLQIITYSLSAVLDSELNLEDVFYLIANIIEARDPYTKGHSLRVAHYGKWIAKKLELPEEECEKIFKAGILHDIGKIGIPDIVLLKPGRLTDQEYEIMKLHAKFSYHIINSVDSLKDFASIAAGHHERWDGRGYPNGLKGEQIPLGARILAIADTIDAMTSTRPYKKALSFEKAKEELFYNAGKQFDPNIVFAILPHIEELKSIKSSVDMKMENFLPEEIDKLRNYVFFHDAITGCYHIPAFLKKLDDLIVKEEDFCLAIIDIKNILDFIEKKGFDAANQILIKITQIIQDYTSLVARESDMFFFVIKDKNCEKILNDIVKKIKESFNLELRTVLIKYSDERKTAHALVTEALKRLKAIKREKEDKNESNV